MRLLERAYLVPLALVLLHIVALPLRVNHDCAQFLVAGRILLEGGRPYLDVIDTNPPLVMYLSAIPALLEKIVPLHAATIFNLLVLVAAIGSTEALRRLLRRPELELTRPEVSIALVLWATATLSIDVNHHFGQRDHLFMLCFHPYALLRWLRWRGVAPGRALSVALGLAAGTTACFRPMLLVLIAAPEIVVAVRRRLRSIVAPETLALAAAGAVYAAHFLLLPAAQRDAILLRWLPFVASGYSAFDEPLRGLLRFRALWLCVAVAALPLLLADVAQPFSGRGFWRLARAQAWLTLLGAAIFVAGGKPWPYRLHPAFGGAALVLALVVIGVLRRLASPPPARAWLTPLVFATAACLSLVAAWQAKTFAMLVTVDPIVKRIDASIRAHSRPGDPILLLTTGVTPGHPALLQTNRRPATRYLNFFPIAIFRVRPDPVAERAFIDEIQDDLTRAPPAMVFVIRSAMPGMPKRFDIEAYFERHGLLPGLLAGYYPVDLEEPGYSTYVRSAAATAAAGPGSR